MLRLVHPGDDGNTPSRRYHTPSPLLSLTDQEARNVRAAIRGVARTFGSLAALANALGVDPNTLSKRRRPAPGLVIAVARLTGVSVDVMLAGQLAEAGVCIVCGAKGGAQ
jgi:hypothetical protein